MSIDSVVQVSITRQTAVPTAAGFGTPLILTAEPTFAESFRYYSSLAAFMADVAGAVIPEDSDAQAAVEAIFSQSPRVQRVCVAKRGGAEDVNVALSRLVQEKADFYGVAIVSRVEADQLALAAWCETNDKLGAIATAEAVDKAVTADGIGFELSDAGYDNTFWIYHEDAADTYPECAWLGRMLPKLPGSATWRFKVLTGFSTDILTDTEKTNISDKNGNYYEEVGGLPMTSNGKVASGEWIDVIVGLHWLKARIAERVFSVLYNADKVPYTNAGIATIQAAVESQLQQAVDRNVLSDDPAPVVIVPLEADIPPADKANRVLNDVTFSGVLAGAIHRAVIAGTVSV